MVIFIEKLKNGRIYNEESFSVTFCPNNFRWISYWETMHQQIIDEMPGLKRAFSVSVYDVNHLK